MRIRSRLAVGIELWCSQAGYAKIKAGSTDSSLHASCNVGPGKVSGKPSKAIYGLRKFWRSSI